VVVPPAEVKAWNLLDCAQPSKSDSTLGYLADLQMMSQETFPLSFLTRYQLEVCISHGYLHENNLTADFLRNLHQMDLSGISSQRWRAIGVLERVAVLKRRFFEPMDVLKLQIKSADVIGTKKPPNHCTIVRSATITPTMVYFNSPAVEISNRVIRGLTQHTDRFLRVRFSEELDYGQIMSSHGQRNDSVYDRIRQILRNGIVLGDRTYEFLAFGNSQFRERGAYFFAPTVDYSCQRIRDELGQMNPSDRVLPAKYCARLGQNFSATRGLKPKVNIRTYQRDSKTLMLPDIKRNGFVFTDGVGKISSFLAGKIAEEFKLPSEGAPAVFQFRLGGCKGVLAIDPTLPSHDVHIRPSQYKFAAIHHGLEIIRTSSFASASLNRQLILVLSALGVPDATFVRKMQHQLRALELSLTNETVALNELQKAVDGNQVTLTIAGMIQSGFMATREPFMMSMLRLWRSWTLKYLKEKAKLSIDQGAFLLGTVDETATLRGHFDTNQPKLSDTMEEKIAKLPEVFCYVDRKRRGVYEAITGVCILARNPSLHPGDIRVVRAVDIPQLHHLTNVVVFPQTGDRDVSNMCSGGDLDGDDYLLIWDKELIPQEWNHAPMDFTAARPRALDHEVTVDDRLLRRIHEV
jgi:RNA-dependent RNA polymerase